MYAFSVCLSVVRFSACVSDP